MTTGWGTAAYGLVAGSSAAAAVLMLVLGVRSRRLDSVTVWLGVYGLTTTIGTITTLRLHTSTTIDAYADAFKVFGFVSLAGLAVVVGFVAYWTHEVARWELVVFAIATVVVGGLQLGLPSGLLTDEVVALRTVELFGEQFVLHDGRSSPWRPVLDVYLVATLVMVSVALVRRCRRGGIAVAALVVLLAVVGMGLALYDTLVDEGVVDTPYLSPFGQVFILVLAAAYLADRTAGAEEQLSRQAIELEATVIARTAQLIDVNDRLEQQIAHQRQHVSDLAELTNEFEAFNTIVEPIHSDLGALLERLLAHVGSITSARRVELRIRPAKPGLGLPDTIGWDDPHRTSDLGDPLTVVEPVVLGGRQIGDLIAHFDAEAGPGSVERRYLDLTAEHLAGLIARLELVGNVTELAIESERRRIAMDLHDSVTQQFYSVSFLADAAVHMADDDPEQLVETLRRLRELVLSSIDELRSLLLELRPAGIAELTLAELIGQLSAADSADWNVAIDAEPAPALPTEVKIGLYRIAQEALSNARRHSGTDAVSVRLRHERGVTTLVVSDQGVGFTPDDLSQRSGLANIAARAETLGAEFELASAPDMGTSVIVRWAQREEFSAALTTGEPV